MTGDRRDLPALLTGLAAKDRETRERLAANGSLFEGYHPEMRAVHESNAVQLEEIVRRHGWPDEELVGREAAESAWLVAQHAIGLPAFQRLCLDRLEAAAGAGSVPRWQPAMLLDRIRVLEGKPQLYGTQSDWTAEGILAPLPIDPPEGVDDRRAAVGLPPLAESMARQRDQAGPCPEDLVARAAQMEAWAKEVGWR